MGSQPGMKTKKPRLGKNREAGHANCSPHDWEEAYDLSPDNQPRQGKTREQQKHEEAGDSRTAQNHPGDQDKEGKKTRHPETRIGSSSHPWGRRTASVPGDREFRART